MNGTSNNPDLDALAAEAGAGEPAPAPGGGDVQSPGDQVVSWRALIDASLQPACASITGALGVDPVTDAERAAIADAGARVAVLYDWANLDPRVVAWLSLGGSVLAVAMPRMQQLRARRAAAQRASTATGDGAGAAVAAG